MRNLGIGGHQSAAMGKDEWLTPPAIIEALGGRFDLDPCAPVNRPWDTAGTHYTTKDNGLAKPWAGMVWLNPPYGSETGRWLSRMQAHNNGVALIFARTETADWHKFIWPWANGILFLRGRLHFHHVDGTRARANAGGPSALVSYGRGHERLWAAAGKLEGALLTEWVVPHWKA